MEAHVAQAHGINLVPIIILLSVAVVAAPLFKRLGLSAVLGYLAGGVLIGPDGLRIFAEPASILQIAELGVVLFLFVIGLEMRPSRLWAMRKQIFGLGLVQVLACALLLTLVGVLSGFPAAPSFVAGAGFVLTSTAIVMQLMEERGEMATEGGQRVLAILLLEDLAIVPLLILVTFLAPITPGHHDAHRGIDWRAVAQGIGALVALLVAGRYLLNPLFRMLARARAREVMTAAALLVVLGAAYIMELGGLSMAMGAFLAGVLLSESSFRHQLEVDIEPFRGMLLGLFFLAVGMSLDISVAVSSWETILRYVVLFMIAKALGIYGVARLFRSSHLEARDRALLMAQGGEFAFVLYAAAVQAGILNLQQTAMLTAIIVLSMVITPVALSLNAFLDRRLCRTPAGQKPPAPENQHGIALIIGFGRVGQIASQFLFARGYSVSIIDTDVEMIQVARELGFDVYYGDGTRLDVLQAAGSGSAKVIVVCMDDAREITEVVRLVKHEYPDTQILARAIDRRHSMELIHAGVTEQVRETFESAMRLGESALDALGASQSEISAISAMIRERDQERLKLELKGGISAGNVLFSQRFDDSPRAQHTSASLPSD